MMYRCFKERNKIHLLLVYDENHNDIEFGKLLKKNWSCSCKKTHIHPGTDRVWSD